MVPEGLVTVGRHRGEAWVRWVESLPTLLPDLLDEWTLRLDGESTHGEVGLVVPVRTAEGMPAMLKVGFPDEDTKNEPLAHSRDLTTVPDLQMCEIVAGLYQRLHVPAGEPFLQLSAYARRYAEELLELPNDPLVPRRSVEQAARLARDLAADPDCDGILIHGDLHQLNVLAADREPWLAIDPQGLSGDPHYEIAPLLWNDWDPDTTFRRFRTVVDAAGLDRDRARDWIIVRELFNVLWAIQDLRDRPPDVETRNWISLSLAIAEAVQT